MHSAIFFLKVQGRAPAAREREREEGRKSARAREREEVRLNASSLEGNTQHNNHGTLRALVEP
jgi:hypothetical protein